MKEREFVFETFCVFVNWLFAVIGGCVVYVWGLCLGHSNDEIESEGFKFGILDVVRGGVLMAATFIPWVLWDNKRQEAHEYVEMRKKQEQ